MTLYSFIGSMTAIVVATIFAATSAILKKIEDINKKR